MDLEEWEILSDDGFLEIHDDGGKQIFSRKYEADPKIVFNMNYFICKSPISKEFSGPQEMGETQFLPPPVELEKVEVFADLPLEAEKVKSPGGVFWETDYIVSKVSFKKENEFVDMKMDSPRACGWGIVPQIDAAGGLFQFEDNKSEVEIESGKLDSKGKVGKWERENGGVNILKWSLNGIGAICSFGVAAATVCVIILRNGNHHHHRNKQQNQKIQFQIFTDEKRIKQVVHHANKLSEAISAAHFTYGGGFPDHGL